MAIYNTTEIVFSNIFYDVCMYVHIKKNLSIDKPTSLYYTIADANVYYYVMRFMHR